MLCGGVAVCHRCGMCTFRCCECDKVILRLRFSKNCVVICYAVVWQYVIGVVCVLFAVMSATRTHHSEQYTHHTYDMMPHHRVIHNDLVFTES